MESDADQKIVDLLRRADLDSLRTLAGPSVVKAVRSQFSTDLERELAEVVSLRYGNGLLSNKDIRKIILETCNSAEVDKLCEELDIRARSVVDQHIALFQYFNTYTPEKSKRLVDFLGLSPKFYLHPEYDDRAPAELIVVGYGESLSAKSYLHSYQKRIKDQVVKRLENESERFLVQMPTGAGKTYTALEAIVDVMRKPEHNKYIVWLVDSNELCEQSLRVFKDLWRLKGDAPTYVFRLFEKFEPRFSENTEKGVVFAGFDKVYSVLNNSQHHLYRDVWSLIERTGVLIVDEAHSAVAQTRQVCVDAFLYRSTANVFGLTATPARNAPEETEELSKLFSKQLITINDDNGREVDDPVGYLKNNGYLAEIDGQPLESGVEVKDSNENRILVALASDEGRNSRILEQIELANDAREPTLVFACTKEHVFALRVLCKGRQIPVEYITGDVRQASRNDILDRFRRGEFFILLNLDILATGIDVPNVKKLIITRPISSRIQYSQILGRALRGPKNGGNSKNTVINVRDNLDSFPDAGTMFTWFKAEYCSQ